MAKKKKNTASRRSNDMYSRLSDPSDEDSRFKVKLGKSRKKLRQKQRKDAKRIKHEKKLEWLKRRKMGRNLKQETDSDPDVEPASEKKPKLKSIYKSVPDKPDAAEPKLGPEKSPDELEIEYLERQLLKNRRGSKGHRLDALQELKSEFIKDGFDEDFLDFLSNITKIGDREKVLDNEDLYEDDNTFVKHRNAAPKGEVDGEDFEDEDAEMDGFTDGEEDGDEEEEEEHYEDEEEGSEEVEDGETGDVEPEKVEEDEVEAEDLEQLVEGVKKRQMGLVNRLSEGNYTVIVKQLSDMYSNLISKVKNTENPDSLSDLLNALFRDLADLVIRMIVEEVNVVISLIATQSALPCSLANRFGPSVLRVFLTKMLDILKHHIKPLCQGTNSDPVNTDKLVIRNVLISVCALFHFDMVDVDVIFHLIKLLTEKDLNEDVLQLLLILLKYSGHSISKDPDIIKYLNELIEKYKEGHTVVTNRIKYIEEELNRTKKSVNVFDQFEYLKNLVNSKLSMNRITINMETLTKGTDSNLALLKVSKRPDSRKDDLIKKATQIGLNKDIQKTIFICIMDSISPENALNNILQVKLKNTQYNDVVNIIIYCYLIEREFNYYYLKLLLMLTSRLNVNVCKKYKKHVNNNVILYFKNFESITQNQAVLLAKLFYHLIINKVVKLRLLNFIGTASYNSASFKHFATNLFGHLVTVDQDSGDAAMEEFLIQELLAIKHEKYFSDLAALWRQHLEKHCGALVAKSGSPAILFKSFQRVFQS